MTIRFTHGKKEFAVDTPEEAVALIQALDKAEAAATSPSEAQAEPWRPEFEIINPTPTPSDPWHPEMFDEVFARMGQAQRDLLNILLASEGKVADIDLRLAAGVGTNQALAGVLSGISKQALALGMDPRRIFKIEHLRRGTERKSFFVAAEGFRDAARAAGHLEK